MANKKENRPLVRAPEDEVGRWRHYSIILKSYWPTEDAWQFDEDVKNLSKWLEKEMPRFVETLNANKKN